MSEIQKRDLVLPPGSYAYMQDVTKGVVKTYSGPTVINPTAQERPVVYDAASNTFRSVASLEEAMRISPIAAEGYYIILRNPAKANKHPDEGSAQPSAEQEIGRTIIVPGPGDVRAVAGPGRRGRRGPPPALEPVPARPRLQRGRGAQELEQGGRQAGGRRGRGRAAQPVTASPPPDLTVGKQLIIRGTEVSFYIPPTGIEVVREHGDGSLRARGAHARAPRVRDPRRRERQEALRGRPAGRVPAADRAVRRGARRRRALEQEVPRRRAQRDPGPPHQGDRGLHRERRRPTAPATSCSSPARTRRSTSRARSTRRSSTTARRSTSRPRSPRARRATS